MYIKININGQPLLAIKLPSQSFVINHLVNQVQPRQENRKNNEYAMTSYQFNVLTENEKTAIVWSKGDFVIERKENNFSILLYQVQSFYVEVFYSGNENKISKLRSFSSIEQLESYLGKIDISGLIT